ncbi:hypothetical protein DM02DRAFT_654499 [Periconia macrospinosa]|uniref:Uncharacterized protein n=1 Tax=Periconia macrospinosa TaxID=97972 RepID=A0A2V1DT53_9PLEO|nr:hypothetical protein DM02DRAFT_654499 [Periconia macrospinosa]
MPLTFQPQKIHSRPKKRCRAAGDVDGEHSCTQNKKRRLRLFLITSRLSPQYSQPATNIVDRGHSKIAVWAKQKAMGRNLLCKASILNRIRRQSLRARDTAGGLGRVLVEQEREQQHLQMATLNLKYGSHDTYTHIPDGTRAALNINVPEAQRQCSHSPPSSPPKPHDEDGAATRRSPNDAFFDRTPHSRTSRRSYLPLPPSPLGLSNYDAFDQEDDIPDPYAHLDEEYETAEQSDVHGHSTALSQTHSVYSDFSILNPDQPVFGDYDQVDEGADAIWPSTYDARSQRPAEIPATSPNIPALFAPPITATTAPVSSPNLVPSPTMQSPNFPSPLLSPALTPTLDATSANDAARLLGNEGAQNESGPGYVVRDIQSDHEEEKKRQKSFMFLQFG